MKKSILLAILAFLMPICCPAAEIQNLLKLRSVFFTEKDFLIYRADYFGQLTQNLNEQISISLGAQVSGLVTTFEDTKTDATALPHELYIRQQLPSGTHQFGYLKTRWGKLDNLSLLDVVTPTELSTFFYDTEREEAKIPVLSATSAWWIGDASELEIVFLPFFEEGRFDLLEEEKSPFNPENYLFGNTNLQVRRQKPPNTLESMEGGLRIASTLGDTDFSLVYFNSYSDFPSYRLERDTIVGEYPRRHLIGADFETVLGEFGLRGEVAYIHGIAKQLSAGIDFDTGDSFAMGLGVDHTWASWYLNTTIVQTWLFFDREILEEKNQAAISLTVERKFLNDRWVFATDVIHEVHPASTFLSVHLAYNLYDGIWLKGFMGHFDGRKNGTFTRFENSDFIGLNITANF